MIVDTSVWIDYFAAPDSTASRWLADRIARQNATIIVPEVVLMELLIGTTDEDNAALRRRLLQRFDIEPLAAVRDAEDAAAIHRRCRRRGDTVRSLIDCQVAAMALRLGVAVAHRDRDFEVIRAHCGLRTEPLF
jgi:predicted nucleic acid-binding protein